MRFLKKRKCRMCGGRTFRTVLNLGQNPLVNNYVEKKDLEKKDPAFPLVVRQCQDCHLVQLTDVIDTAGIYRDVDYFYFSSDMPKLSDYYGDLARDLIRRFIRKDDLFVEIGSNDGIMLHHMAPRARVLGVDPATNVVLRALRRGLPTVPAFFNERLARQIRFEWGPARVVMGANVLAHLDDLNEVMRGVRHLLADDGVLVMEANYWGSMVKNADCSLIYHDHLSYYSVQNWVDYAPEFGLKVFDAHVVSAQNGNIRVFMDRKRPRSERCKMILAEERRTKLNTYEAADRYRREVLSATRKLGHLVKQLKRDGARIAAYGAAAKGFSVLKLAGIDETILEYFIDDSPAKQGKYTPLTHIPIRGRKDVKDPDYFIITAPNYEAHILAKEGPYREKGGKFITFDARIV